MTDVLFTFDVDTASSEVRRALTTTEGITSFWTDTANVSSQVGQTTTLNFPDAPASFDLELTQADEKMITWRTQNFPPQWVGTSIRWAIKGGNGTSTVAFRHGPFTDDEEAARVAYVWGQVMVQLKRYVETGIAAPVFVHS